MSTTTQEKPASVCDCGSGQPAAECCEAPPAGPGRMLALAGVLLLLVALFVYRTYTQPVIEVPANGIYSQVPGVDLSAMTPEARDQFMARMNSEACPCGECGFSLAKCANMVAAKTHDCTHSMPAIQKALSATP